MKKTKDVELQNGATPELIAAFDTWNKQPWPAGLIVGEFESQLQCAFKAGWNAALRAASRKAKAVKSFHAGKRSSRGIEDDIRAASRKRKKVTK